MHVGMIYHPPLPPPTTGVAFDAFQVGFDLSDRIGLDGFGISLLLLISIGS